jgi:predicted nuclease with TOPRIM domain
LISNQITTSFEAENAELRRRLELVEKEKAKLELELRKLTADYNEALLK